MTASMVTLPNENIDEDFTVRMTAYRDDESVYSMNFYLYEITGKGEDGKLFYGCLPVMTEELDNRPEDIHLFIKWDGCSHLMLFDNIQNCMYHLCGITDIERFFKAVRWCYDKAKEVMEINE